jgi:glycine cleavage system H protein
MNPDDRRYTKEHAWVKAEGDGKARIGITAYAVEELGDVVYFELPKSGESVSQAAKFGEVESVKAVSDLFAPISGEILEVNAELSNRPEAVNEDSWEKGWLLVVRLQDEAELAGTISAQEYSDLTST